MQYTVILEYGGLTKIMNKKNTQGLSSLTESEKCLCTLGNMWKEEESKLKNQGLSLLGES